MMRRIFAMLLTLAMLLTTVVVVSVSAETTADDPIVAQMGTGDTKTDVKLSELATKMAENSTDTFTLTQDIVLSSWSTVSKFSGTFDGAGFTVSGLTKNFFNGLIDATVKNVTFDATLSVTSGGTTGIVASYANGSTTLEKVTTSGSITLNNANKSYQAGGMIGNVGYSSADNQIILRECVNHVTITGSLQATDTSGYASIGGLVGTGTGTGGAAGTVQFISCVNNGSITLTAATANTKSIGGFIGNTQNLTSVSFKGCTNNGKIDSSAVSAANSRAGGFIAYAPKASAEFSFINCANNGAVSAYTDAAGFLAASNAAQTLSFTSCTNSGNITNAAKNSNSKAAGFVCYIATASTTAVYRNCYNDGAITAYRHAGGYIADSRAYGMEFYNSVNAGAVSIIDNVDTSVDGFAAGFAAQLYHSGTVGTVFENCINLGTITVNENKNDAKAHAGGFVGIISMSFRRFANNINAGAVSSGLYAGGLVSKFQPNDTNSKFENCLVNAAVTSKNGGAGGLFGYANNNKSSIWNGCYYLNSTTKAVGDNTKGATFTINGESGKDADALISAAAVADLSMAVPGFALASQEKDDGSSFSVRFLAALQDGNLSDYQKVGFDVMYVIDGCAPMVSNKSAAFESTKIYEAVLENKALKTAADIFEANAKYISLVGISGIPENINVTFIVRPYIVDNNGTEIYGTAASFAYANGSLQNN